MYVHKRMKRVAAIFLLFGLAALMAVPSALRAEETESQEADQKDQKVVRVGWFDSTFCYWDSFGRRCGIDYEYRSRISAYTGWTYEYVEDSWSNLFQMLKDGQIDLLSDVSFKPERTEFMLFPDLPMGSESYYIYIDTQNREITSDNLSSFDGKRIGVNQGSIQEGFLKDWAQKNGVNIEVVPLSVEEDESMDMVAEGELDGYASIFTFSAEYKTVPICRIGSSDYFYAVNKNRPDLLAELNMALASIQDEDPYFNQRLSEERLYNTRTNAFLTPNQEDWLKEHGVIRVGYQEDYLPFCETDRKTGELTGALKDYLAHAENNLRSTDVRFEAVPYSSVETALEAMKAGEIDCVFPVYLSSYDADEMGVRLTNPAMKTEMNACFRTSESQSISRDSTITFAVTDESLNIDTFIMNQYPASERKVFESSKACYEAAASGDADCVLVSNYRLPSEAEELDRYKLFSVPTGETMPLSFAVDSEDRELYFLLNKTVLMTDSEDMDTALASYMESDDKVSFTQFLKDNWMIVLAVVCAVFFVIIVLLYQKLKAERVANEQQRLLEEADEIAELKQTISSLLDNLPGRNFTKDAQTGVYLACNQAFADYAKRKNPEDVIGLTDEQIFDAEQAKRLVEDDRMAVSMDGPYIFFEDVPDAEGNQRQIKTTRLKYTDAAGRLCVLGISVDVTADTVRIHRGDVTSKESYEKARSTGIIYSHIAQALARGYTELYYIDLNTEGFIEYRIDEDGGSLTEARRGWHFFEECQEEAEHLVYHEDREAVIKALDRKTLVDALDRSNIFIMTYRLNGKDGPVYVTMKVTRMKDDDRFIILGVTDVDEQTKQRNAAERMKEEQIAYARLSALAGDYLCIYLVVPETGRYREFSATAGFETFERSRRGMDFFADTREQSRAVVYPEDLSRFLSVFTRENVMADIGRHGLFTLSYRLVMNGSPRYVQLKAVMLEEKEGIRLIVGVNDINAQVRQEEAYATNLARAQMKASVDALTGVKNRHAYLMAEERLNAQIREGSVPEFAIVVLDVNDLKKVNDSAGHEAGDQYIRDACRIICNTFKHSPVFRIGGDEFAVIAQGDDYARIENLIVRMKEYNAQALGSGGIVIACGMARNKGDASVAPVFERADQIMYENKSDLKDPGSRK